MIKKSYFLYSSYIFLICALFFYLYSMSGYTIGWMAFVILALYFATNSKLKDLPIILINIIFGLIWSQINFGFLKLLQNLGLSPQLSKLLTVVIITTITMFLHISLLKNTFFNRMPFIFI